MRLRALSMLSALMLVPSATLTPSEQPETSKLAFVREYISTLAAVETIRETGEREFQQAQATGGNVFTSAIHTSTRMRLELRGRVLALGKMRLNAPYEALIPGITRSIEQEIALHQRLIEIASAFVAGPKDGVDYGELAAEMPQVRAKLDYVAESLFQVTSAVFLVLVDQRPDSKGHVKHLVITKAEKAALIEDLTLLFGSKLDQKEKNYGVSSAVLLRDALHKDFRCADEPWE